MKASTASLKAQRDLTTLVMLPEGEFWMGSNDHYPEEFPVHKVRMSAFSIEQYPVTNRQFAIFTKETGYRTVAQRRLSVEDFPDLPEDRRAAGSMVFVPTTGPVPLENLNLWWEWTVGAYWKKPEGPGSHIKDREDHPVVHVAYEDSLAYAHWAGRDLPTEAQWEYAARGGLERQPYCWGDTAVPNGKRAAKYYDGAFPWMNVASDGHKRTAPVGTYPPNHYGLFDMAGNVWEWTQDWYAEQHSADSEKPCCVPLNPRADNMEGSLDDTQPQFAIPRRVLKGGSFLCADEYCHRYRPAARRPVMVDSAMSHIGFRCVVNS